MRVDEDGKIWNIVIGAAAGAVINAIVSAFTQIAEDSDSLGTKEFWAHLGVSTVIGAISGGFAASRFFVPQQIIINTTLGAIGSVADCAIDGGKTLGAYALSVTEGAISGALSGAFGGRGTASKHVSNSFKRVLKNGNWSYYFTQINKQAVLDGLAAIPGIIKSTIPSIVIFLTKYNRN